MFDPTLEEQERRLKDALIARQPITPEPHDCDAELKARSDYSAGRGTPPVFDCSCGKRYRCEYAGWEEVR